MPPASDAALWALARRYQDVLTHLSNTTGTAIGSLWDRYGGVTDEAQAEFAKRAARVVAAAQQQIATAAVRYVETYASLVEGERWASGIDPATAVKMARQGTPVVDVYRRPTVTARTTLARGGTFDAAMAAARARAVSAANTDVALAARQAAADTMQAHPRCVGYRRVPDSKACAFCLTASTQRYRVVDLMPLHNYCHCTIAPIIGDRDPGQVIDRALLERLKRTAGRPDYWNAKGIDVAIHQHGELGPVLAAAEDAFDALGRAATAEVIAPQPPTTTRPAGTTSPADVVEWVTPKAEKELAGLLEELDKIHGFDPADGIGRTTVRWGGKTTSKGGHFAPQGPRTKRKRGESFESFRQRRIAAMNRVDQPEILVNDTGERSYVVSFLHELGHRLDYYQRAYLTEGAHGRPDVYPRHREVGLNGWDDFFTAATRNDHFDAARKTALQSGTNYWRYFTSRKEVWARAYAQWSSKRIGGDAWTAFEAYRARHAWYQWPDELFDREIAPMVEKVLQARGLMT